MVEMATGSRPTREELSTYPPPPRYNGHCDCCGGADFEQPSPAEVAAWQRYVHDNLIGKKASAAKTSGISSLPPSSVPILGTLSFQQPESFLPRPSFDAPTTRSHQKVRYSQEKALNALLRSTTLNEAGRGLVQPAPQPVKGQRSKLRSKESTKGASSFVFTLNCTADFHRCLESLCTRLFDYSATSTRGQAVSKERPASHQVSRGQATSPPPSHAEDQGQDSPFWPNFSVLRQRRDTQLGPTGSTFAPYSLHDLYQQSNLFAHARYRSFE